MKQIAVVEDNADNRLLLHAILEDLYRVREYAAGSDALAGIREHRPDLILLDISLPGMDGTKVLAALRDDSAFSNVPILALTAHAMTGDRERYLEAGFDDYIPKPIVDPDQLLATIARWLERRGRR